MGLVLRLEYFLRILKYCLYRLYLASLYFSEIELLLICITVRHLHQFTCIVDTPTFACIFGLHVEPEVVKG